MNRAAAVVAIGVAVLLTGCGRYAGTSAPATTLPSLHPASALVVTQLLPSQDLAAAHLTNVATMITPFHVDATDKGRTITLIGAYADPARTVLFFRGTQRARLDSVDVEDDSGPINAGGSTGSVRPPDDYYFALDRGPHPGSDGLAHLSIKITYVEALPLTDPRRIDQGNWSYSVALKVQSSTALPGPSHFQLGRWNGDIEVLEVTPSVIHVQAVIHGAGPSGLVGPSLPDIVTLLDPSGRPIGATAGGATITVPKQQVNPVNYLNSRINYEWPRPPDAGTLQLRFQGGGGVFTIPLTIGALQLEG